MMIASSRMVTGLIVLAWIAVPATQQPARDPAATGPVVPIPGVVAEGTSLEFIRAGFNGTEGVIGLPDESVLFTEQDANRIIRIDNTGRISTYLENTNRTIGLALDGRGRLIGTQSRDPKVAVLSPTPAVLADSFAGQPLVFPNDLVVDSKGGIYFSDPVYGPQFAFRPPPPGRQPLLFYITPTGVLTKLTERVTSPNGLQLSVDEKTLYATNGGRIVAFDVGPDGSVGEPRPFAETGGDGLAIDNAGRLYAATGDGVRVIGSDGRILGTISTPGRLQSIGFAGPGKRTLYAVGFGAVYRITTLTEGIRSRAK